MNRRVEGGGSVPEQTAEQKTAESQRKAAKRAVEAMVSAVDAHQAAEEALARKVTSDGSLGRMVRGKIRDSVSEINAAIDDLGHSGL